MPKAQHIHAPCSSCFSLHVKVSSHTFKRAFTSASSLQKTPDQGTSYRLKQIHSEKYSLQ
jgi:hypothetical protein